MREFAEAFLLVFAQIAVGGAFALAIPPFHQLERGFFKSTAAVYLFTALVAVVGWATIRFSQSADSGRIVEIAVWVIFTGAVTTYLASLWGDRYRLRARSYLTVLGTSLVALTISALRYRVDDGVVSCVLYPLNFAASAAVLGTAFTGMLLGHWYLIDLGLTLTPFRRMHRLFVVALHAQVALIVVSALSFALFSEPGSMALAKLWSDHSTLLFLRLALGPLAACALGWMIGRALDVPQTMAATGLFYIALLAVIVGEILGRTILFRTSLPL